MTAIKQHVEDLLAEAKSGCESALGELLERYRPYLRVLAAQAIGPGLGQRYDASDVIQQTCMEAVNDFPGFSGDSEGELSAWLRQILRRNVSNLVRDNRAGKRDLRKEQPLFQTEGSATLVWVEPKADTKSPSQKVIQGEAAIRLASALEALPHDQQVAVRMRFLEGRPLAEVAQELERSVSAVAGLLHRGVRSLRGKLTDL